MARIEIDMIDTFVFETILAIRVTDINKGGHVGNDAFVSLIQEARVRFLKNFDFPENGIKGTSLMISDLAVVYKSPSFYGDRLKFEIGAGDFNKYGCDLFYRVTNTRDNSLVLLAKNNIVFFDTAQKKVTTIPGVFSSHFL